MQKFQKLRDKHTPRLNLQEYRAKLQKFENRVFAAQIFNRYVKAKGFCVQNLVFLRVYTIHKKESCGTKVAARPKTEFCVREYETNCSLGWAPRAIWSTKTEPKHETF